MKYSIAKMRPRASGTTTRSRSLAACEVLELPAPADVVAARELHLAREALLGLGHERRHVAAAHVRLDDDPAPDRLAADLRRPGVERDLGELARAGRSRPRATRRGRSRARRGCGPPRRRGAPPARSGAGPRRRSPRPSRRGRPRRCRARRRPRCRSGRSGRGRRGRGSPAGPPSAPASRRPRPGRAATTRAISSPFSRSVSRSSPKSLTPTSERTPAISSLKRISIGWVKEKPIPGTASSRASLIFSTSSPLVRAVVHSDRGFSITNTSPSSMPMTSVASSGLPERLTTVITSGNRFRTRSIRPVPAATSEMATEAGRMALIEMSPSSSRGMNSPPSLVARRPPAVDGHEADGQHRVRGATKQASSARR